MTKRTLNTATLDQAAKDWAGQWFLPTQFSRTSKAIATSGRDWVLQSFYNATFKDEFEHLLPRFKAQLGPDALAEFEAASAGVFTPRDDAVFEQMLAEKLAINPAGEIIPGKLGTTQIGMRVIGTHAIEVETPGSIRYRKIHRLNRDQHRETHQKIVPRYEPVFAGDLDFMGSMGALVTNISAEMAILGLDAALDAVDEGTGAAVLQGRSGVQPADPDAAVTGTLLFTLVYTDPAFLGAADQADGTVDAAASAITDDTSADATATLGYCRVSATNDGATPLDDHIDGEAGVSGADFNFNTLAIVSGATVSMSSHVVTWSQGSTAT